MSKAKYKNKVQMCSMKYVTQYLSLYIVDKKHGYYYIFVLVFLHFEDYIILFILYYLLSLTVNKLII